MAITITNQRLYAAALLVLLSIASSLRIHPHYTSYFNSLSGGPANGWKYLGFSNIDWGQDLSCIKKWLDDNPDCRPVVFEIDYFSFSGELFDLPRTTAPELPVGASIEQARSSETEWWIVSVKKLYNLPNYDGLQYLQAIEPVDKIGYAYHVYRIEGKATYPR